MVLVVSTPAEWQGQHAIADTGCLWRLPPRSLTGDGKTVVTVLCDGGGRYASTVYNPAWLEEKGLRVTTDVQNLHSLSFVADPQ